MSPLVVLILAVLATTYAGPIVRLAAGFNAWCDAELHPSMGNIMLIGDYSSGIWKTTDYGRTWEPIFDDQPTGSIGDIAVALSNPNVIYVGSGEGVQRPDLSVGDGVLAESSPKFLKGNTPTNRLCDKLSSSLFSHSSRHKISETANNHSFQFTRIKSCIG